MAPAVDKACKGQMYCRLEASAGCCRLLPTACSRQGVTRHRMLLPERQPHSSMLNGHDWDGLCLHLTAVQALGPSCTWSAPAGHSAARSQLSLAPMHVANLRPAPPPPLNSSTFGGYVCLLHLAGASRTMHSLSSCRPLPTCHIPGALPRPERLPRPCSRWPALCRLSTFAVRAALAACSSVTSF